MPSRLLGTCAPKKNFRRTLLLGSVAASFVVVGGQEIFAQCAPAAPVAGDTVTCSGAIVSGGFFSAVDDLTVVVDTGASFNPGGLSLRGSGTLTVTNKGSINAASGTGIYVSAKTGGVGNDVVINSSGTVSTGSGVSAKNFGSGYLSLVTADITASRFDGITTYLKQGTDLTIDATAGTVLAQRQGITSQNRGSGALSITTANVTASSSSAISAYSKGTTLSIDTSAGTVMGNSYGITGTNRGSGVLAITTADVTSVTSTGIYAGNSGTELTVNTTAGTILGTRGISAGNLGSGAVNIIAADVTGTTYAGISVGNSGTDLTINSSAGTVIGNGLGIVGFNRGSGDFSITTADVTSANGRGV